MTYFFRILFALTLITFVSGCDLGDIYDSDEIATSNQDEEATYNDPAKAQVLLDQLYGLIPTFTNIRFNGYLSCYTDEAADVSALSFNVGAWSPNNVPGFNDMWSGSYRAIRTANKFLENIGKMPPSDQYAFTESTREYMIAQARCLRAFYYSELIRCFGGVPIITNSFTVNDTLQIERHSLDSVVKFVVAELDSVVPQLPTSGAGQSYGRVTKGVAMAIKSRLLLYMASPLFNSAGADGTGNPLVCYGSEDKERWVQALDAANALIKTGTYALFTNTSVSNTRSVYANVFFLDRGSTDIRERIFSFQKAKNNNWNQTFLPLTFRSSAGWPHVFPTYNAHIAFEMQDGKLPLDNLIDNGDGTYEEVINSNSTIHAYNPTEPYQKRDPRYYDCILFNQSKYRDLTCEIYIPYEGHDEVGVGKDNETFGMKTGFYNRKFANPLLDIKGASQQGFEDFPIYRYAEILLNYAEAMNEAYGPGAGDKPSSAYPYSAVQAVNMVRARAKGKSIGKENYRPTLNTGMPALPNTISQEDLREAIRQERRIELIFEGHRFFDVRRWMIAEDTEKDIYYYDIRKKNDDTFVYFVKKLQTRVFDAPKMYLLPIPFAETQINKDLKQNPGW
ncbi:MAG: RagB/SusD family nutrient uptake outer membrane protein [Pigmentiphaga sp.]|nr:RagB/SusD family nutrient uptake outer membrane protein [Pigmentiphaga sp.]